MITNICNSIQLDLNSGAVSGLGNLPIDQVATYKVSEGADMTINLAGGGYALIQVSLSVDKESERYKDSQTTILSGQESIIKNAINNIVRKYTKEEFNQDVESIQKEVLKSLQATFGADYIVGVTFPKQTTD